MVTQRQRADKGRNLSCFAAFYGAVNEKAPLPHGEKGLLPIFRSFRSLQKLAGIGVLRVVKEFVHRVLLHDGALFHDQHPGADLIDHIEIMADEQIAQIIFLFRSTSRRRIWA